MSESRDMDHKREYDRARVRRMSAAAAATDDPTRVLRERVRSLERELLPLREAESRRQVEAAALAGAVGRASAARWNFTRRPPKKGPGTPFLFLSDLHMNERVESSQVLGANVFSPELAKSRLRECFETATDLAMNHMVLPQYVDGVVVPVGGDLLDMLQGSYHPSERQSSPRGLDAAEEVADALQSGFRLLADAFGLVYSPWVTGNHGRLTARMPYHDRNAMNLDKAVYQILEGRLRSDRRFQFELAPGPRLVFSVYPGTPGEHRYLLAHGDPASGFSNVGDSEAGFVASVVRSVKRLRALHMQLGLPFDTALVAHYHQYGVPPGGIIMNGSLPGFSEYASGRAFAYDPPRQAFWFHHQKYGITCSWPIYVGKGEQAQRRKS